MFSKFNLPNFQKIWPLLVLLFWRFVWTNKTMILDVCRFKFTSSGLSVLISASLWFVYKVSNQLLENSDIRETLLTRCENDDDELSDSEHNQQTVNVSTLWAEAVYPPRPS